MKNNGAIPATIAIMSGKIHVGGCDLIFYLFFCLSFFCFFFFRGLLEKNYKISIQSQ